MANQLLTPSLIAKEMVLNFRNALVLGNSIHRDYVKEYNGGQGGTVTIRKPSRYSVQDAATSGTFGATATAQDMNEPYTSITVNKQKTVMMNYTMGDKTLSIEEFTDRHIKPAALALANQVEQDIAGLYTAVPEAVNVGTSSTSVAAMGGFAEIAKVGKALDSLGVPNDKLHLMLSPSAYWDLGNQLSNVYNEPINKQIMRQASLGRFGNFDIFQSQNIKVHTGGSSAAATAAMDGATTGTVTYTAGGIPDGTFALKAITSGDKFAVGDTFTIAGVFAVNPITKASTGRLKSFTVSTAATSNATAYNVIASPGMVTSGVWQNVSNINLNSAAVTLYPVATASRTGYFQNLAYHSNAFALVMVPLAIPEGAGWAQQATVDNLSVRMVKDYTISTDTENIRVDILYGVKCINPEFAVRLVSA